MTNVLGSLGIGSIAAALITAAGNIITTNNLSTRLDRLLTAANSTTEATQRALVLQEITEVKRKRQVQERTRSTFLWGIFISALAVAQVIAAIVYLDQWALLAGFALLAVAGYVWSIWAKELDREKARAKEEIK